MTSPTGLDLGCEGRKIIARYLPGDPAVAPTRDALQALLVQQKWHTAALDEVAIEAFLKTCQESAEEGNTVIGELHDGSFEISVSSDAMTAWLTLRLPMGGQAVDPLHLHDRWKSQFLTLCEKFCVDLEKEIAG